MSDTEWGKDILGEDTLDDGEKADIEFETEATAKFWDLKVEDEDGNAIVWKKLNLLEISKITLHYNAETKKATAEVE